MKKRTIKLIALAVLCVQSFSFCKKVTDNQRTSDAEVKQILEERLSNLSSGSLSNVGLTTPQLKRGPSQFSGAEPDESDKPGVGLGPKVYDINYDAVDLTEVINQFSKEKGVNIILPTGANAIKSKLTLKIDKRITIEQAQEVLHTLLDIAGYSLIERLDGFVVVKNDKDISRVPAPIYVGVSPENLPDTDERIQYLYYLVNIQVPDVGSERQSEIDPIFSQLLPKNTIHKYIPSSNGVLLAGKSNEIKAVMKIILELDGLEFRENLEIVKLQYSSAAVVADIFTKNILQTAQRGVSRYKAGWRGKSETTYFSKNMKIIPEFRTNSLILLGRQQSIERVKEFIFNYIDVKLDSGKSILHTYQLQYLDAQPFAQTLQRIVASASTFGTGQSRAAGTAKGPERFFEGVIIKTDTPSPSEKGQPRRYFGGNQLIIAARNDDWLRIKELIEELDRPQPQVIIEVLIADLEIRDERELGSHIRTPAALNLPETINGGNMEFQAASSSSAVASTDPPTMNVDLIKSGGYPQGDLNYDPLAEVAKGARGIITLSDAETGHVWSLLHILQAYQNSKILSHPHIVATNNQEALVVIGEKRLIQAEATVGQGGAAIAKRQERDAKMTVKITPRISGGSTVNMQVSVIFKEWIGDTASRIDRKVITNANVESGSILALGGLIKFDTSHGKSETPILGKIPILGWLFKSKNGKTQKNNLTVFIRPTIVPLRLRGGIDRYTKDYINVAKDYVKDGMLFDTLRDPITRWFFKTGVSAEDALDVFAEKSTRHGAIGSKSIVSNDELPPPSRTVMAAAEGRVPKQKEKRGSEAEFLELKNQLMDYPGEIERSIVAKKRRKKSRRSRKKERQLLALQAQQSVIPTDDPIKDIIPEKETEKIVVDETIKKSVDPDEQLKKMLAGEENPLLG